MGKARKFRPRVSDNVKAGVIRWWMAGMCYFMIGFGTRAGMLADPLDLIFFLGVGIGLVTVVIYDPIVYSAFDVVRGGEIVNKTRKNRSGARRALDNLLEIGTSLAVVVLIYLTYQGINELLVKILERPEGTAIVPGEPFSFATLYLLFYSALVGLGSQVAAAVKAAGAKSPGEDGEEEG